MVGSSSGPLQCKVHFTDEFRCNEDVKFERRSTVLSVVKDRRAPVVGVALACLMGLAACEGGTSGSVTDPSPSTSSGSGGQDDTNQNKPQEPEPEPQEPEPEPEPQEPEPPAPALPGGSVLNMWDGDATDFFGAVQDATFAELEEDDPLTRDENGEPYDTFALFWIEGGEVYMREGTFPEMGETIPRELIPSLPSGTYRATHNTREFFVPGVGNVRVCLDFFCDLLDENDNPILDENGDPVLDEDLLTHVAGFEEVYAYTDKEDADDTDYVDFGYWSIVGSEVGSQPGELLLRLGAYAKATSTATADLSSLTISDAGYVGEAVGRFARAHTETNVLDDTDTEPYAGTNDFIATVSLTANFADDVISGEISDFKEYFNGKVYDIDEQWNTDPNKEYRCTTACGWSVDLEETSFNDQGIIAQGRTTGRTTSGDAPASQGYWEGMFQLGEDNQGDAILPPAVTGKFTAHFDSGGVVGAFVATEPQTP